MNDQQSHEELVEGITGQMKPVLDKSVQAIYLYLDDTHKVCNQKFADLFGYKTPGDWAKIEAPLSDIVEEDQQKVIDCYMNASEKMLAGVVDVKVKNVKTGKIIKARMIVAPIAYKGAVFTAHFLSSIK